MYLRLVQRFLRRLQPNTFALMMIKGKAAKSLSKRHIAPAYKDTYGCAKQ